MWQAVCNSEAAGAASVRRDQELPCAGHRDSSAGSIMDTPQDTAEPIRVVGGTSVKIYLRKVKTSRREMSKEKNSKKQQREHHVLEPKFIRPDHTYIPVLGTSCWLASCLYNKAWFGC